MIIKNLANLTMFDQIKEKQNHDKSPLHLPRQVTKIVLKPLKIKDFFKIRPEFTTLLRQMKSSYDKYVVKAVKIR